MLGLWQKGFIGCSVDSGNPALTRFLAGLNGINFIFLQMFNAVGDPLNMVLNGQVAYCTKQRGYQGL
jgi:hypothetical protein